MRNSRILRLLALSLALFAAAAGASPEANVKAHLISEVRSISPGATFRVALEFDIREGWHTYWRNPGDSGKETTLSWNLPPGFSAGPILWTAPHRFDLPPLVNYGYAGHAMHIVSIEAPKELRPGTSVTLRAGASWLVCSDVCIPESTNLALTLPVSAAPGAIDSAHAAQFAAADRDMPVPAPALVSARLAGAQLVLSLGKEWGDRLAKIQALEFFPYDDTTIEYAGPQTLTRRADGLELALKPAEGAPTKGPVRGLLVATMQDGAGSTKLPMEISAALAAAAPAAAAMKGAAPGAPPGIALLLLFAVAGGLILNLMPCVFPVLSIKAIGLVEQARKDPAAVRAKGLVFAAGVIISMLALAAALLALRAGGEQIGWGFQLQSPLFVTLMVYLLLAVGLNLSGVFEVGGGLAGVGDTLTQGSGYRASFFTGVLTTLVATPCTAPFMAAAVGAALTQPVYVALGIFAALGVGLALPYLLLSFAPGLRGVLPKPGAWMDTLKQIFAFPMYASAAWLLWVLAQQSSMGLAVAFAGSIMVAFAAWALQKSRASSGTGQRIAQGAAILAAIVALALPLQQSRSDTAASRASDGAQAPTAGEAWQPYDAAKVAELAAAGKPVLVNFTASWCLTCLFNERTAFKDPAVQAMFRDKGVILIMADWTNSDPKITAALASFGRAGVPLYVLYNASPGASQPQILPQLLTAGIVRDALAGLPDRKLN